MACCSESRGVLQAGRNPAEILIFTMMTVITAATSEAARAKLEDYRSYVSEKGALVLMSGWAGVDFSRYRPDEPVRHSRQDAQTSGLARGGSREARIVGHIYPEGFLELIPAPSG